MTPHGRRKIKCPKCGSLHVPSAAMRRRKELTCAPCKAAYNRRWNAARKASGTLKTHPASREYHRKYRKDYRQRPDVKFKNNMRDRTYRAIRSGKITPKPCKICGAKAQGHHPDYKKPMKIVWLCAVHHQAEHKRLRDKARKLTGGRS